MSRRPVRPNARVLAPLAGVLLLALSAGAHGQSAEPASGQARALTIVPRLSVSETFTNNVRLADTNPQSDQITELSPGIRVNVEGARLKTHVDYALTHVAYAQGSSGGRTQNALNAFGTLEAMEQWAFVDFNGAVSQQAISAFGAQSDSNSAVNANRAEVSTFRVSPYLRGRLGAVATYEARYNRVVTGGDAAATGTGVSVTDVLLDLNNGNDFRRLGWSAKSSRQTVDYSAGRSTVADRIDLGVSYEPIPHLKLFANVGHERNNYTSLDPRGGSTHRLGLDWRPSERTKLHVSRDSRSFGGAHLLSVEHRTARTSWKFSDSRDVSAAPSQYGLLVNSADPVQSAVGSFLISSLSLQRRQDLSFSLMGIRDTVSFIATQSESNRLDTLSAASDDFSSSLVVRQAGFSVSYVHRLTPDYRLGLIVSQQNNSGSLSTQDNTLRSIRMSLSGEIGRKTSASMGLRHVVSSGSMAPYTETAVSGNLSVKF